MKQCPHCLRTYSDDSFSFCLEDGSLLSVAHDPDATLVMEEPGAELRRPTAPMGDGSLANALLDYDGILTAPKSNQESTSMHVDDPVVAICINQQYPHCKSATELYECARGLWRLNKERADKAKYAFAVYRGVVKEVYEIDKWITGTEESRRFWVDRLRSQGKTIGPAEHIGRYEFTGRVAPEYVRKKYLGQMIPARHKGNPILYFNCVGAASIRKERETSRSRLSILRMS